jgi:tRNA(Leu) C34 or U34 (ribose-2'-O)-methylase TrmL
MKLRCIVDLSVQIEQTWNHEKERIRNLNILFSYLEFFTKQCHPSHQDLTKLLQKMNVTMTLSHFLTMMVPIERRYVRSIRDDELIISHEDSVLENATNNIPLYIILDNIRSAFNTGAIFRTAECLGVEKIVLCGYTATPDQQKTKKTAMGTDEYLHWEYCNRSLDAILDFQKKGIKVIAMETVETAPDIFSYVFTEPCALLFGNERHGLEKNLLQQCDEILKVPVFGRKNSLNVGISMAIVGYEIRRQWSAHKPKSSSLKRP